LRRDAGVGQRPRTGSARASPRDSARNGFCRPADEARPTPSGRTASSQPPEAFVVLVSLRTLPQMDPDTDDLRRISARLALDALATRVTAALADAGIRVILLKGPAIGDWLYGDET